MHVKGQSWRLKPHSNHLSVNGRWLWAPKPGVRKRRVPRTGSEMSAQVSPQACDEDATPHPAQKLQGAAQDKAWKAPPTTGHKHSEVSLNADHLNGSQ